jgi:two-component system sensor histidine kinase DesK
VSTEPDEDCAPEAGLPFFDHRSFVGFRTAGALIWLLFIIFPLVDAIASNESPFHQAIAIIGSIVFIAAYVALVVSGRVQRSDLLCVLLFAVMLAVATTLTVVDHAGWGFLFTYCAATVAMITPARFAFFAVLLCSVFAGATSLISGGAGSALGYAAASLGIGLLMLAMRDLRMRNIELREARAELARLAVAEERERFARDLHDLLGHTLSVITLKAELAGRLLPARADQAAVEIADVERVARGALGEVRDAVSGYRRPRLDEELAGARVALAAAGIEASVERAAVSLDPAVEAVLAWAVREGATNVIRHSGASRCSLRIRAGDADAEVEVVDNGVGVGGGAGAGAGGRNGDGGHGLSGLADRARVLSGRVEAGSPPGGGFRLAVTVPVGAP